jgi:hypothetical protein
LRIVTKLEKWVSVVAFVTTLMNVKLWRRVEELAVRGRRTSSEEVGLGLVRRPERGMRCHD